MLRPEPFLEALTDGVCVSDAEGSVLYMNTAARGLLGVRHDESSPLRSCDAVCSRLFEDGSKPCSVGCVLRKPGGEEPSVSYTGRFGPRRVAVWSEGRMRLGEKWSHLRVHCSRFTSPLWGLPEAERHFILIEDASAEEELHRHKEEWRRMVAHDLRAPLTSALAALRLVEDVPAGRPLDEDERALAAAGARACERMSELIDLFLDDAQLEEGLLTAVKRVVPLKPIAARCVEMMRARSREKGLALNLDVPTDRTVLADEKLLERVLTNLLDNAVKFTSAGGRVELAAQAAGGAVFVSVRDSGAGIPADRLPYLFGMASRPRVRREGESSGLGLTFCRRALKAMGGEIAVMSEPGHGSDFTVRLPEAPKEAL